MRLSSLAPIAGLLVLASCNTVVDTDQPVGPLSLSVVSGNGQSGLPGTELPSPLVALVEDSRGHAVRGQIVNFVVVSGGGSVFAGAAITNADGIVQERWTLGFSGPQQVEARAVDNATGAKLTFAIFTATLTDVQPPVVSNVATSPANPTAGTPFDITATVSDAATGGSNIAGARDSVVDGPPPGEMSPQDGAFDQQTEVVLAHVTVANAGPHLVCVTGRDVAGNVSSPSCITVVVAEDAIFVSPAGDDAANGTRAAPLKTIGAALALAEISGKNRVNIAQGTYPENVQLRSGISLYGGYEAATWTRAPATFVTIIGPGPSPSAVAVQGDNVTGVTIDGFTITSGNAVGPRESAYGIVLTGSVATISGNHIIAGNGTAGTGGFTGLAGQNGVAGNDGEPGSANGPEGAGGFQTTRVCSGTTLIGGGGGQGGAPGATGLDGEPGSPNGGNGGAGGLGGATPPLPAGQNGQDGVAGASGAAGTGGASFGGFSAFGLYVRADGSAGVSGQHGTSGGGGGGGGGLEPAGGGNGGGSGGTGGCAASGGGGGGGAGGSFGIVGVASNLTITGNTIETGNGGSGGAAGAGALGGAGAAGGHGATNDAPQVGAGGNGGAGGAGGAGGPGGGGGGGPSIGIVSQGGSLAQAGNVFVLGLGGAGGAAAPGGNAGATGLQAQVRN